MDRDILDQPRLRSIYEKDGHKLIAFRPEIRPDDLTALHQSSRTFIEKENTQIVPLTIELKYEFWPADEILASILPEDMVDDSPAGFTMAGHIAHMNIRDEFLPHKTVIGQVILDKNTFIRTVVNKLDTIDSVYRNFHMEVLAGEENYNVEQLESGCKFRFDFSKVYWNSRLHTEHERLVAIFDEGQAVCDVMAGVGPFAIPAGKKNTIVYANDLNPASYEALIENIELNKVSSFVIPSKMDGREFIRTSATALLRHSELQGHIVLLPKKSKKRAKTTLQSESTAIRIPRVFQHYVMNLPASAIEFLDAFIGIYNGRPGISEKDLPTIHVHCFTKMDGAAAEEDLAMRIGLSLRTELKSEDISYHHVRKVAPSKDMYCCSFVLPKHVAFA